MLEEIIELPLDCKEIKSVNREVYVAKADAPVLWPSEAKCQLVGKETDVGKN